jgi:hypothetical protein
VASPSTIALRHVAEVPVSRPGKEPDEDPVLVVETDLDTTIELF